MKPSFCIPASVFFCAVLFVFSCKKDANKDPASANNNSTSYTQNMGGTRTWHRYYHVTTSYPGATYSDTTMYYADTSFAVTVINSSTLNIMDSNFVFERTDSSNTIYYFGSAWEYYQYGNGTGLVYYPKEDSIVYVKGTYSHNGTNDLVYYTYK
jgi:hypothetical protein